MPRCTVITRSALVIAALAISTMPLAQATGSSRIGSAQRRAMPSRAASTLSPISPPRKYPGSSRPSVRLASVMVGSSPPWP